MTTEQQDAESSKKPENILLGFDLQLDASYIERIDDTWNVDGTRKDGLRRETVRVDFSCCI